MEGWWWGWGGEVEEWSLFAARDLVGVFTRDRWIVSVCL